jgi:hypothetical protein
MSRARPYVGKTPAGEYRVFRSDVTPTEETHGADYVIAYGPFRTVGGAREWATTWNGYAQREAWEAKAVEWHRANGRLTAAPAHFAALERKS